MNHRFRLCWPSVRTIVALMVSAGFIAFLVYTLFTSKPPPCDEWTALCIYLAAWILPAASYSHDLAPRGHGWKVGVFGGGLAGIVVLGVLIMVMYWLYPPELTHQRLVCMNCLKQLTLAMYCYEEKHGTFPPAYVADQNGKPMHSWRVLLLPYLEEQKLYDRYDFSKPWNDPANMALAAEMPEIYRCPAEDTSRPSEGTSYMVVTGPGTLFEGDKPARYQDAVDGPQQTILLVEAAGQSTCWLEPKDLDFTTMKFVPDGGPGELSSEHRREVNVSYVDGSVRPISKKIAAKDLRALITPAGGEELPPHLSGE